MVTEIPGYSVKETLFSTENTVVLRVERNRDGVQVILKQLVTEYPTPGQLSRFSFGYEVLSQFDHPNIIKPLEWISGSGRIKREQDEESLDCHPAIIFEDLQCIDLFSFVKRFDNGYLPLESFLNIAVQLAEALSVVHYHQVIHKDLHPGNIIVNPDSGVTQIIDFGLASLLSREQPLLEAPDQIEGVLSFISPEQSGRMNRALDYRSDFYTLGATFYYLLAGHPPFEADDALGLVHAHIAKEQTPISEIRSDIPPVLSKIVDKLLKKTAEERYQSAIGLKQDLMKVRNAVATNKPVPNFPLGMEDISDRFQIPQKLYGREEEVENLMRCFFKAASGVPRMLSVSGYSGIGKSALVHEVHKPIAAYNGLFCAGKFDQFQKNIPYSALQTALKNWIQQTLALTEKRLAVKREQLCAQLGANARVLVDFMPEFALVLGELPPVPRLGADETQNRLHLVFQQFIKIITYERPLVLFIDDLQWADRGTLNLLPLLMSEEGCRLLVIVAYRDNEVSPNHPAIHTLNKIRSAEFNAGELTEITLGPLSLPQISDLLNDALHRPASEVKPLVNLVHVKTAGNPFFINEFLKTLYTEQLLNFDLSRQRWYWNIEDIKAKDITDNVVDLMLDKMEQLPQETQDLIQLAACVGSRFDLEMLARLADQSLIRVTRTIWPALRDGLLLQDGGDWYLGMIQQTTNQSPNSADFEHAPSQFTPMAPQCRFLHDRMLQAAYRSMSSNRRQDTHLTVGRMLLKHYDQDISNDDCFAIVGQLNKARSLIKDEQERQLLANLNLRAAKQAWNASVWQAASEYSEVGIEMLPENPWSSYFDEAIQLYHIKAECEYLRGNPQESEQYYEVLFTHLEDDLFRAQICSTRLIQSIGRGDWRQGVEFGYRGLSYIHLTLPAKTELSLAAETEQRFLTEYLKTHSINSVSTLPEMENPVSLTALCILANLAICGTILGRTDLRDYCTLKGCNMIFLEGKSDYAAMQLTCYAYYLQAIGHFDRANAAGRQAKLLSETYIQCREVANCYNMLANAIWYLKSPLKECCDLFRKGMHLGLENGEIARAGINRGNILVTELSQGNTLEAIKHDASTTEKFLINKAVFHPVTGFIKRLVIALTEDSEQTSEALSASQFKPELYTQIQGSMHYAYLSHYRAQLCFWQENYAEALKECRRTEELGSLIPSVCWKAEHYLLYGLLLLRLPNEADVKENESYVRMHKNLEELARLYAPNFEHKYLLLQAEKSRWSGDDMRLTCGYYRDSINSAQQHGFVQYQALASELFAEFWMDNYYETLAEPYINEALYLYRRWGCLTKVVRLQKRNLSFLARFENRTWRSLSRSESRDNEANQTLDMASVMKSAQVISSELQIKQLSAKVLEVIAECVGATSASLVIQLGNSARVHATVDRDQTINIPEPPVPLEECKELPVNVANYVLHSTEIVNIGDALIERAFADDPYIISHQPRSILCVPIEYRDKIMGVLYLENRLSINAFTADRLAVINLLLAQAAISFENAQLFKEVTQLNQTLEQKVEQRTEDLNRAVRELKSANEDLNSFSYSVSHDLRAPLRSMKGFSQAILDEYGDSLEEDVHSMLMRIIRNGKKMSDLIEGLLELSRVQRREIQLNRVNLSGLVAELFGEMRERNPDQKVSTNYVSNCWVEADERMLYSALENLINNAWKYTSYNPEGRVEFGVYQQKGTKVPFGVGEVPGEIAPDRNIYFIRDNGAGFDTSRAGKIFGSFQRLHSEKQFQGTGVGLATVKRVFEKHGCNVWADSSPDKGATFYFTLKPVGYKTANILHS